MNNKEIMSITVFLLLVISLGILYFNEPGITGFAAKTTQEDNKVYGIYSILPSFKAEIDYDLSEYDILKEKVQYMYDKCSEESALEKCLNRSMESYNKVEPYDIGNLHPFQWGFDCRSDEERFFYDFVENYNLCLTSGIKQGICEFKLSKGPPDKNINIIITKTYDKLTINIEDTEITETFPTLDTDNKIIIVEGRDNQNNPIKTKHETLKLEFEFDDEGNIDDANFNPSGWTLWSDFRDNIVWLYKNDKELYFIDPEKKQSLLNFYLDQSKKEEERQRYKTFRQQKNTYKLCAKSKKYQFYIYNSKTKKLDLRPVEYRFALKFKEIPPPPVNGINVADKLKDENSLLVSWEESPAENVEKYVLFFSEKDFSDQEILAGVNIKEPDSGDFLDKVELFVRNKVPIEDIDLTACKFDSQEKGKPCKYKDFGNPLIKGKLYFVKGSKEYLYALKSTEIDDNKELFLSVVAVDYNGNFISNKYESQRITIKKGKSKDDLSPGLVLGLEGSSYIKGNIDLSWPRKIKNKDGSEAKDVSFFNIYYLDSVDYKALYGEEADEEIISRSKLVGPVKVSLSSANCLSESATICSYTLRLAPNTEFLIGVSAVDDEGNEIDEVSAKKFSII